MKEKRYIAIFESSSLQIIVIDLTHSHAIDILRQFVFISIYFSFSFLSAHIHYKIQGPLLKRFWDEYRTCFSQHTTMKCLRSISQFDIYQKNLANTTNQTMVPPYDGNFDIRALTAAQLINQPSFSANKFSEPRFLNEYISTPSRYFNWCVQINFFVLNKYKHGRTSLRAWSFFGS